MARAEFMPRPNSGSCPTSWKFDDAAEPATGADGEPAPGAAATIAGSHIVAKPLTKTSGRRIPTPSLTRRAQTASGPQSRQSGLSSAWAGVNPHRDRRVAGAVAVSPAAYRPRGSSEGPDARVFAAPAAELAPV